MNKKKIFLLTILLCSCVVGAAKTPTVLQNTDVHMLSRTYCKNLWSEIQKKGTFEKATHHSLAATVLEVQSVLKNIAEKRPIIIDDHLNTQQLTSQKQDQIEEFFDADAFPVLNRALVAMSIYGKHKGGGDFDSETMASINDVFIHTWGKVKTNPLSFLTPFLIGLLDAEPTCIQGYSIRMLCSVYPPE